MNCLHLFQQSQSTLAANFAEAFADDDAIVIMNQSLINSDSFTAQLPSSLPCYLLSNKQTIESSNSTQTPFIIIDYPQLVTLCAQYPRSISW